MPTPNDTSIDTQHEWVELGDGTTEQRFFFVIRTESPVRNWTRGCEMFKTRAEAMQNFQDFCAAMGWVNMATEVPIDG